MKNLYMALFALVVVWPLHSQILVTQIDAPLVESFDGMGAAGTSYVSGWTAIKHSGTSSSVTNGTTLSLISNTGASTSGGVYNVGSTGVSDRAFGVLASGGIMPAIGASFINNSGAVITSIDFSGVMEQWKSGSDETIEKCMFEYSFDATSLSTGNWIALVGLDLVEKLTNLNDNKAVDGNLEASRTSVSATVTGLKWAPGSTLWIRWIDNNDEGSDGMYAIDDFQLIPHANAQTGSLALINPVADQTYQSGQVLTFKWTAVDVDKIKFQMQMLGSTVWTDVEDLMNIDATLGQLEYTIPTDITGGQMQLRIVNQNNTAIYSAPSGLFTLADVHFAGLKSGELWPGTNQADVPTDLVYGYIKIVFAEDVAWGQGSIYLRKGSDNSSVRTFNATSRNASFATNSKRVLLLHTEHELPANTQYYVSIEANAIVDMATVPNTFAGFSDNSVWSFTTGSTNSIVPIETIQTPVDATDVSPKNNQKVKAKGTVMYRNGNGYFIQEGIGPFMGIYVSHVGNTVESGDLVEVYGTITESSSFTEFNPVEFTRIVGKRSPLYDAIDISSNFSEQYESMLVRLTDVKVASDGFATAKEFTVSDAAASITWTIDDFIYGLASAPSSGIGYNSITGFLNGTDGYKLAPRKLSDLVQVSTPVDETMDSPSTITYQNGTIVVESDVVVESVSVTSISGTTASSQMNISSATEGEKGKEIVIPVRKSGSLTDDVLSVSYGSQSNFRTTIKLQRKLLPGIYVVRVVFVNKTMLSSKVLVR